MQHNLIKATKRLCTLIVMGMFLSASTACFKYNSSIVVDADGMATANIKITSVQGVTEQFKKNVEDNAINCEITPINDSDFDYGTAAGYEFKFAPKKLEELRLVGGVIEPAFIKTKGILYDTYQLRCIPLGHAIENNDKDYLEAIDTLCRSMKMNASFAWSITLPYAPVKHNAGMTENDGKTLIWTASDILKRYEKLDYYAEKRESVTGCKNNLKNIGTALEMYSCDHAGRYPERLSALTQGQNGGYLKHIPTCPAAGKGTYVYTKNADPDVFTLYCSGSNHKDQGYAENSPGFDSLQGIIEEKDNSGFSDPEFKAFIDEDWISAEFRIYHRQNIAGAALAGILLIALLIVIIRKHSKQQPANSSETKPASACGPSSSIPKTDAANSVSFNESDMQE
ncbi:MAG: hypothetical protein Q4F00_09360 [bacterium]|nr:hypothetical protein [bacterium]